MTTVQDVVDTLMADVAAPTEIDVAALAGELPAGPVELTVGELAEELGVTSHTLRYYERIGLLDVPRNAVGNRRYDVAALRRVLFVARMRAAGMSIAQLQRYFALVDEGPHTQAERLAMLVEHRQAVRRRIAELQFSLAVTDYKIAMYRKG